MKNRNVAVVVLLSIITFGIYTLYWSISTKNEMNRRGANIPTAWLLVIPFVSIYWTYKYCEGVDQTTDQKLSTVMSFVLLFLLGIIGMAIIQNEFNKLGDASASVGAAPAGPLPDNSFGGPVSVAPTAPVASSAPFTTPEPYTQQPQVITPTAPAPAPQAQPQPEQPTGQVPPQV